MKLLLFYYFLIFLKIDSIKAQNFENAIEKSRKLIEKLKNYESIPGLVVGINYKGKQVWVQSFGYSDIENDVKCRSDTVLRTGSVSKAIATALVSKLVEQSKIDWDLDIHHYINESDFPKKQWKGEDVNITVRQLITMTAGIRTTQELKDFRKIYDFHNVTQTLSYFCADPLISKPGTEFHYSNWGWHLIGAVMESVTKHNFELIMNEMFSEFHLNSTQLSRRERLIPHRSRPYTRARTPDKKHWVLKSAALIEDLGRPLPWLPMGAVITSVPDLLKFSNVMISCYKTDGYLKSKTVRELWTPRLSNYGMGWYVKNYTIPNSKAKPTKYVHYSGSVAGSVNTIALIPELDISVALIANLGAISLDSIALNVINEFVNKIV